MLQLLFNLLVEGGCLRGHALVLDFVLLNLLLLLFEVLMHLVLEGFDVVLELLVGAQTVLVYLLVDLGLLLAVERRLFRF